MAVSGEDIVRPPVDDLGGVLNISPQSLLVTAGGTATILADAAVKENIINTTWSVRTVGVTQLSFNIISQTDYNAIIEVDATRANSTETGEIVIYVSGQKQVDLNYQRYEASGTIPYRVLEKIEPEIPILPTEGIKSISYLPSTGNASNLEDQVMHITITSDYDITKTVWNVGHSESSMTLGDETSFEVMSATGTELKWQITEATPTTLAVKFIGSGITKNDTDQFNVYATSTISYEGNTYEASKLANFTVNSVFEAEPTFVISTLRQPLKIASGQYGEAQLNLLSNKTIQTVDWTIETTTRNGLTFTLNEDRSDETIAKLVIDSTNANINFDLSDSIKITANIIYLNDGGLLRNEVIDYDFTYLVYFDSDPVLTLSDSTIALDKNIISNFTASVSMDRTIISTEWLCQNKNTAAPLVTEFKNKTATSASITVDASLCTANATGELEVIAVVKFKSGDGSEKTKSVSKRITYVLEIPYEPEPDSVVSDFLFNPNILELNTKDTRTGIVTMSYTSQYNIVSCDWSARVAVGGAYVNSEFTERTKTSATYKLSLVDNIPQSSNGVVRFTLEFVYTLNGANTSKIETFDYPFKITAIPPEGVEGNIIKTVTANPEIIDVYAGDPVDIVMNLETNYPLNSTVWKPSLLSSSQCTCELISSSTNTATIRLYTANVTEQEIGLMPIKITANCTVQGFDFSQQMTTSVGYKVTPPRPEGVEGNIIKSFGVTPDYVELEGGETATLLGVVVVNYDLTSSKWSIFNDNANSKLNAYFKIEHLLDSVIVLDASACDEDEEGILKVNISVNCTVSGYEFKQLYTVDVGYKVNVIPDTSGYYITANPGSLVIGDEQATITVTANAEVQGGWEYEPNELLNVTITSSTTPTKAYYLVSPKKITKSPQQTTLTIRANWLKDKSKYMNVNVPVIIKGTGVYPVWQDNIIQFDSSLGSRIEYTLRDTEGNTIYSGKASKMPDEDYVTINISNIMSNFINNHFPAVNLDDANAYSLSNYGKTVDVIVNGNVVQSVTIYNSWGYKDLPHSCIISDPIRKVVDRRQIFMCSVYNPSSNSITVKYNYKNGSNEYWKFGLSPTKDRQSLIVDGTIRNLTGYNQLKVDNMVFDIIDSCADWCLYYSNAYGGWDSLLLYGNVKRTDNINSQFYTKSASTNSYQAGKTKYLDVITPTYTLNTDWFNDEEQAKFHHLIESTEVYLHNLKTDDFFPVVITDNKCEYKTFTNNGKKKWNNTINVEESKNRLRK